jgi:hypothetical protein
MYDVCTTCYLTYTHHFDTSLQSSMILKIRIQNQSQSQSNKNEQRLIYSFPLVDVNNKNPTITQQYYTLVLFFYAYALVGSLSVCNFIFHSFRLLLKFSLCLSVSPFRHTCSKSVSENQSAPLCLTHTLKLRLCHCLCMHFVNF